MTHEIMNSVGPITSLAETMGKPLLRRNIEKKQVRQDLGEKGDESLGNLLDSESLADITLGISTIRKRSESLLKFADTYCQLGKISMISFSEFYVRDLFEGVEILSENQLELYQIEFNVVIKDFNMTIEGNIILIE